jgi:hypothetical protein
MKYVVTMLLALTLAGCAVTKHAGGAPLTTEIVGTWRITATDFGGGNPTVLIARLTPMPAGFDGYTNNCNAALGSGDICYFIDLAPTEVSGTFYYPPTEMAIEPVTDPAPANSPVKGQLIESDAFGNADVFDFTGTAPGTTPAMITGQWACQAGWASCQGMSGTFTATKQ